MRQVRSKLGREVTDTRDSRTSYWRSAKDGSPARAQRLPTRCSRASCSLSISTDRRGQSSEQAGSVFGHPPSRLAGASTLFPTRMGWLARSRTARPRARAAHAAARTWALRLMGAAPRTLVRRRRPRLSAPTVATRECATAAASCPLRYFEYIHCRAGGRRLRL